MRLQRHHIIDLYVAVDDVVASSSRPKGGRPPALSTSEIVTILIWNTLTVRHQLLKDIYRWIRLYHQAEFPRCTSYTTFVDECHRALPALVQMVSQLLHTDAPVRAMDSTMLEVCQLVRADRHKVAQSIAQFGKNHQGWHYGFKLHASINPQGQWCGLAITPANLHDAQLMPYILNDHTTVAVGDSTYGAKVMGKAIYVHYGTIIIAPPHYTQTKKVMTHWQHALLLFRRKIESSFDYLKNHLHLVSSFPRSINGYFLHYLRILLGYQVLMG